MRNRWLYTFVLLLALTLAGCAGTVELAEPQANGGQTPAATATVPTTPAAPRAADGQGTTAPLTAASNDPATAAIQKVIQQANEAQQEAFAKRDPSLMKPTATSGHYQELAAINADLAEGGVSAIKLVDIEWGPITLTSATTAQATTFETWQTTLSDGSTLQSRDRNVYVLVQEQGVWKVQSNEHPDADQPNGSTTPAPAPSTAPPGPSGSAPSATPLPTDQTDISRNWSGYAATGGTFTSVTGTWVVPDSNSNGQFGTSAAWVGIGGVSSRDLIQAGTLQTSAASGAERYSAWVETLPQAARTVPLTVRPGDSVTVSITEQAENEWLIVMKNNANGQVYQTTQEYESSRSSAEWIQEAPSIGRRIVMLDNFDIIDFTGGSAVRDGKTVTIAEAGARPISMLDGEGNIVATPTGLTADGGGFSVHRTEEPAPAAQPRQPGRRAPSQRQAVPSP